MPDPVREHLAGRVFEARDFVQVMMVELVVQRSKKGVQLAKIDEPAGVWIDRPFDGELDLETVAVKAKALVGLRQLGKPVSRFETKFMDEPHVHRGRL